MIKRHMITFMSAVKRDGKIAYYTDKRQLFFRFRLVAQAVAALVKLAGYGKIERYSILGDTFVIEEQDFGPDYQDSGSWRSYDLESYGSTRQELIENAGISETDQDGGTIDSYDIVDFVERERAVAYIHDYCNRRGIE